MAATGHGAVDGHLTAHEVTVDYEINLTGGNRVKLSARVDLRLLNEHDATFLLHLFSQVASFAETLTPKETLGGFI
jgi:hypothetical protein